MVSSASQNTGKPACANLSAPLIGGIEAGGTKFVLSVGTSPTEILASTTITTADPQITLMQAAGWFEQFDQLQSLGIASFGPIDLDPSSSRWGHILETPKPGWTGCDLRGFFARRFSIPVGIDTDVNGAALAEFRFGAGRGAVSLAYITVGTGIGVGLVIDDKPVLGLGHPEMGHILPRRAEGDQDFPGVCPYHGDCLEGLASGSAIAARYGKSLSDLSPDHTGRRWIAEYLGQLCHTLAATVAVEIVVLGGGVMQTPGLIDATRNAADMLDQGYLPGRARQRIVMPQLVPGSGAVGSILLGQLALQAGHHPR
ncbi:ROK family protein [Altererythrobacter sp. SALINAS58]|uniref:ROK family protein n=1 Tax=Alteripontixanthobacter muriae TaxID=2705546 RepID=UPI0015775B1E|nr:ROK family protein [Alteripontixanthobacter muriae]NTZ43196.1 ROK family protein [Alteripontixanthobacter muriae]